MNNIAENFVSANCCGCGACVNICPTKAISFSKDEFGFIKPLVDEDSCLSCGKCVRSCPYQTLNSVKAFPCNDLPVVYAAENKKQNVIKRSSSGGVFYSIAQNVLNKGGLVFGAHMGDDFKVCHTSIESTDEIHKIQRSKYVQSFLGDSYSRVKKALLDGRLVLFSGTPCQIAGLKTFLRNRDYENLLTVEVVCHGVPNQDFFDDYRSFLESKYGPLNSYTFRYKEKSKNGMKWYSSFETKDRKIVFNWPEDSYNYFYMKSLVYRDSCYECRFAKKERNADITLCDYWHWDGLHKKHFKSASSVSGIIANTQRGVATVESVAGEFNIQKSDFGYLSSHNSCLIRPCGKKDERFAILEKWKKEGYAALDADFRRKHKWQILKYRIMRHLPDILFSFLYRLKNGR